MAKCNINPEAMGGRPDYVGWPKYFNTRVDFLNISINNPASEMNRPYWFGFEDPYTGQNTNSPITSGSFYGYREVLTSGIALTTVIIHEQVPVAGRIWVSRYDSNYGSWTAVWEIYPPFSVIANLFYPVGTIYLQIGTTASPASNIGGSWACLMSSDQYRFPLLSSVENGNDFIGGTQVSGSTVLTTEQMPSHRHQYLANLQHQDGTVTSGESFTSGLQQGGRRRYVDYTQYTGSNQGHTHTVDYQPFIAITAWRRIS